MFFSKTKKLMLCTALAGLAIATTPAKAGFVNILTGGTSGVYYPLGVALSKIYAEKMPNTRTQVQSTKASVENMNLLQQNRGELAIALGDTVQAAVEGDEEAGFKKPLNKLRGIAALYPNYVQIVASKESGIRTLADLKGKRISVGAPKSGTELNARSILKAAGMSYKDFAKTEYLPYAESVELMKNRQLDATLQSAGLGVASLKDLSTSMDVVVVAIPENIVTKLGTPYVHGIIPGGTYTGQKDNVHTAAIMNFLVSSSDVSENDAYQMTKLLWDNLPAIRASHKAAEAIDLKEAIKGMPVPLHPGAAKFYKEKGLM